MKAVLLAALLLPTMLLAQNVPNRVQVIQPRPQGLNPGEEAAHSALPVNYQVTLTITDKEGQPTELSVVTVSKRFTAGLGEQNITFQGLLTLEDSGTILIEYSLSWSTPVANASASVTGGSDMRQSTTTSTVRLKPGEPVPILQAGGRTAQLSVRKWEGSKAK